MSQAIRFCTTRDKVKLAYAVSGEGPPLVLSASWLTHLEHQWRSLAWRPWLQALSSQYTVLRYDSRGCGLSDRDIGELDFQSWIGDFECVIEAARFERFALLGTCQGGPIAVEYAARHPERVSALVLYGTYAHGRFKRHDLPKQAEQARLLLDLTRHGWGQENHAFLQVWAAQFQPGGSLEHLHSWSEQMRAATSMETALRLLPIAWDVDVSQAAQRVKCPALVIHPERDRVVPVEEGRLLAGLIANSRFVSLDSENHMPLESEPAWSRLLQELRGFLGEAECMRNALPLGELTVRERDILECIARGLDNAEIARSLGLAEKTVRNNITRVFDKIGVEHRYEAIVRAREAGLAGSP